MPLRRALELLQAALELPPAQRSAHVRAAAADDAELCIRTLDLLAAHARSEGFLEPAAAAQPVPQLGPYRLIEKLGSGGMGQVWLAERDDGSYRQQVAIKLLASLLGDPESRRRAEAERQFLAWLDHPHIARVLDGGTTAAGQPYLVMEYVDGVAIDRWCREQALDLRERITLFLQLLSAVAAVHRALIVHRDIKPANILVDAQGQSRLLDFGIAKSLDAQASRTRTGLMPLTPEYASPEQLLGQPLTTAADIYSLGLLLDELLTGRARHAGIALTDLARHIADAAESPASARVDAAALNLAPRQARDWRRRLHGDLDRVIAKALAPEPAQRYESASAFADDLQRWLHNRPVLARAGGLVYRWRKFLRRNRLPVAVASAAVLALALGLGLAAREAGRAAREGDRALRANRFLADMIGNANPFTGGKPILLVDALDRAVASIPQQLQGQPLLEADVRRAIGDAYLALERNDAAKLQLDRAAALRAGEGGTEYARVLSGQAQLDWRLADYARAEQRYQQALQHCDSNAAGQRLRSELLNDYAALLNDQGRYAEALPLLQQAWQLKQQLPEVLPRDRYVNLSNLANALDGVGRRDEAYATYEQALQLAQTITPLPELDISIGLNNFAYLQDEMGRKTEAAATQERAVALTRKVMGPDYPRLSGQLSNLAQRYLNIGRNDDAATAIADALRLAPSGYDADDPKLGHVYVVAASIALARGDRNEAATRAQQALAIYARTATLEPGRREKAAQLLEAARVPKP